MGNTTPEAPSGPLLVALRRAGYTSLMIGLLYSPLRGSPRSLVRTLMLVLGILAMPSTGQAAVNGSHCARHEAATFQMEHAGGMDAMMLGHQVAAWQDASSHTCPHCPASECPRIAPCAGASSSVIAVSAPTPIAFSTDRVRIFPIRDAVHSVLRQPPTPPPLLVS